MDAISRGREAEDLACQYLKQQGLRLVSRNYRCRRGEIDLIMTDRENLVFIEVRYRSRSHYGSGAESVQYRKQQKLIACAHNYLQRNPAAACRPGRFDVVAISPERDGLDIQWIPNAFTL